MVGQAVAQLARAGFSETLIRTPSAGGKALRGLQHVETIFGGAQMHFAAQRDVGLHGGTEGIHVAVGVFEGKHVVALRKRAKVGVVLQIALGHVAVERLAAALVGEKKIFGESVRLVPGVRRVLVGARALLGARKRFFRQICHHGAGQLLVNIHRHGIAGKLVGVNQVRRRVCRRCRRAVDSRRKTWLWDRASRHSL